MNCEHKQQASGKWFGLTFYEQMANIGSEVERAMLWKEKNREYSLKAIYRALELLYLTISDRRNCVAHRLKELCRLREMLIDYFCFDNRYLSTNEFWGKYFYPFYYVARKAAGKL